MTPPGFNVDSLFAEATQAPNGTGIVAPQRPNSSQSDAEASSRFSRLFRMEGSTNSAPPASLSPPPMVVTPAEAAGLSRSATAAPDRPPSQGMDGNALQVPTLSHKAQQYCPRLIPHVYNYSTATGFEVVSTPMQYNVNSGL